MLLSDVARLREQTVQDCRILKGRDARVADLSLSSLKINSANLALRSGRGIWSFFSFASQRSSDSPARRPTRRKARFDECRQPSVGSTFHDCNDDWCNVANAVNTVGDSPGVLEELR